MARALAENELLQLIDALAAGEWCSGETLAAQAGITRAALAKRMEHLREWGLVVETQPGLGYRLERPLDRLNAAELRDLLAASTRARLRSIEGVARTDSTNERLLEADAGGDPQALFAELQTAGRGRRGRAWRSPFAANLYFSLAWTFPAWPPQLGTVSLAVGIVCAKVLRALGAGAVMLKWPNDLRVGDAKLGGILIEQRGEAGGACRLVIGIGVNVAMTPQQAGTLDQAWTSVDREVAHGGRTAITRNALAAALLDALVSMLARFERDGFTPFAADWGEFDAAIDRPVRILGVEPPLEGVARGIDRDGALIVETGDGRRHHLHAGEVSVRLQESET
jgi:BirA family biotin operon repressor/biotin-[acetyl-CoA-carboxylase] ligase